MKREAMIPAHGCDEDHNYLMGYGAKEFTLPNRVFMPNYSNADSLGTPGEAQRSRDLKTEQVWSKVFVIGVAVMLALVALRTVYAPSSRRPAPYIGSTEYLEKAKRLKPGTSRRQLDEHERCMVWMHQDLSGMPLVSSHC